MRGEKEALLLHGLIEYKPDGVLTRIVLDKGVKNTVFLGLPIFYYPRKERIAQLIDLTSDCSLIGYILTFIFFTRLIHLWCCEAAVSTNQYVSIRYGFIVVV